MKPTTTSTDGLLAELRSEETTTRRVLERGPDDQLSWKPHPKSMSLGQLPLPPVYGPTADEGLFPTGAR